ncbi:MAG: alpha/beta hydrolase, partial [Sphingobacterium sp.]
MAQQRQPVAAAKDERISKDIRDFLTELNSGDDAPIESLAPDEARQVLIGAQDSVRFNYLDIQESEQTISSEGIDVNIH